MTDKAFEREIIQCLQKQAALRPLSEPQDAVKLVFQAMLGPGHLLADRETVTDAIAREMDSLEPDLTEKLMEPIGPDWCRLNLRRAMAEQITPSMVAGLMLVPGWEPRFTRQDVRELCAGLGAAGMKGFTDDVADRILDRNWLPSHSDAYRKQYGPAYRVISSEWLAFERVLVEAAGLRASARRSLVTVDGPCASGKTTLARRLAEVLGSSVIHTDDFVVPHAQKTKKRLATPGGNCDSERLVREVLEPWKRGRSVTYRKYDCGADRYMPGEGLPDDGTLILEGCYCNLPELRRYADLCLYLDTPETVRTARLERRESPGSLAMFREKWIPLENAYFRAYGLPDGRCIVLNGMRIAREESAEV